MLDNFQLDLLDGHRIAVDTQDAGCFAGGGAKAPGELREVVRGVKAIDRVAPFVAVNQVVPVWDDVAEGAALVTERDAAIHTARGLLFQPLHREVLVDFEPVMDAFRHRPARWRLAPELHESRGLSHGPPPQFPGCRPFAGSHEPR